MTDVETSLYRYRANVVSVYDGDTVTANIDLGLGVWSFGQKLRLYGIDTPELRGSDEEKKRGRAARDWLRGALPWEQGPGSHAPIIVETIRDKTGKYGRWLAVLWIPDDAEPQTWRNLNDALVTAGHAVPRFY